MSYKQIQPIIESNPSLSQGLYKMGFVLTDKGGVTSSSPYLNSWKKEQIDMYTLYIHPIQHFYCVKTKGRTIVMVGHAYNPFDGLYKETDILKTLVCDGSRNIEINKLNELTGVFTVICISGKKISIYGDAAGMQTTFWGAANGNVYVSSHTNIIGDLAELQMDEYVKNLSNYKFFRLLGNSLPGDLTPYKEIKRLTPNFCVNYDGVTWSIERFYTPSNRGKSNIQIVDDVSRILHKTMELIPKKWERPAISCTGGCDSKTTMACTIGLYDKFKYFSYISNDSEEVDALAAKNIVTQLGLSHKIYRIPNNDDDLTLVAETDQLLFNNAGDLIPNNKNDVRKRRFFEVVDDFDVEVKSWGSEIGRAYYSKRFNGRRNFGKKPTPRKCTAMYKFFLHNRSLVHQTDEVFKNYIDTYFQQDTTSPVDWQEQLFWEFRVPSWNGLVITAEHRYSFDITIPYNNRLLLELLISAPLEDRINDTIYRMIRDKMNPMIDKTGIAITNIKHTDNRAKAEDLYYWITTHFPF